MIKCNVQVCGIVHQSANTRTNAEGKVYTYLTLDVSLPSKEGQGEKVEVSVIKDGEDTALLAAQAGRRIEMAGSLTFRVDDDTTFLNLFPNSYNLSTAETDDFIRGTMEFKGKVGKRVDEKKGKGGKPVVLFSAFSSKFIAENDYKYIWVNFYRYDLPRESWLKPKTRIEAKGALGISLYKGRLSLSCRVSELSEQVPQPQSN